jgi:methionyl-tRNA synthetase
MKAKLTSNKTDAGTASCPCEVPLEARPSDYQKIARTDEHEALQCPSLESFLKQYAVERGDLFCRLSDKNGKGKEGKARAQDEYKEKICTVHAHETPFYGTNSHFVKLPKYRKVHKHLELEAEDGDGPVSLAQYL